MSSENQKISLPHKVAAGVLLAEAIPAFFLDVSWQGWLLLFGVAVLAFLVAAILTRGQRV